MGGFRSYKKFLLSIRPTQYLGNFFFFFPREYIHRVGRTARAGSKGKALLFLTEDETMFIRYLKAHKVNLIKMDITWSKILDVQKQVKNCSFLQSH